MDNETGSLEALVKKVSKKCTCEWCIEYGKFKELLAKTAPLDEKDKKFLYNMYSKYNDEMDAYNHLQAIYNGDWPRSVEYLEKALEKAKLKRQQTEKENI